MMTGMWTRGHVILMSACLMMTIIGWGGTAFAGGGGSVPFPLSVGVVDVPRILSEAEASKKAVSQREKYLSTYQSETVVEEKKLRAEDEDLGKVWSTLSADEITKRRSSFQEKVVSFQKKVQVRRQNLEKSFGRAMEIINDEVIRSVDAIASERGLSLVLYRSQVFLFDPRMDITEDVLIMVNKNISSVTLEDPDTLSDGVSASEQGR